MASARPICVSQRLRPGGVHVAKVVYVRSIRTRARHRTANQAKQSRELTVPAIDWPLVHGP